MTPRLPLPLRAFQRLSFRRQLAILVVIVSVVAGAIAGGLFAWTAGSDAVRSAREVATALADNLAVGAADDLLIDDFASLDVLVAEYARLPNVVRLRVFDARGVPVAQVLRSDAGVTPLYDTSARLPDPLPDPTDAATVDGRAVIAVWRPIEAGSERLGYVSVDASYAPVAAARRRALIEGLLAGLAVLAMTLGVLTLYLRTPIRSLNEATEFARQLDRRQGETLPRIACNADFARLSVALNDVSLRLRDQSQALRESEAWASKLATVASRTTNAVVLTDADVRIEWVNEGFERMTGYTLDEVRGLHPGRLLQGPDTEPATVREIGAKLRAGEGFQVELVNYHKDGRKYWVDIEAQPVKDDDGQVVQFMAIETDVTERKKAAQALAERNAFVTTIMDTIEQGITVVGPDLRFVYVNPAFERITGRSAEALLGRSPEELFGPGNEAQLAHARAERVQRRSSSYEMTIQRPDGEPVEVLVTGVPRVRDGAFDGTISVVTDVTERNRGVRDLRAAKDAAERADMAKSAFLSRMSHELRTPLNAILGFSQLLDLDDLTDDQHDSVDRITTAGKHLLSLINEVLELSRIEAGEDDLMVATVTVGDAVERALRMVHPLADARRIRLERDDEAATAEVAADEKRLHQVLLNLLSNAIKYNREGGRVTVATRALDGGPVRILVRDTGPGIPADKHDRVFIPFDRLDVDEFDAVEGTGIGLALTKRLVEAMDGRIGLDSDPGFGSTFWIELPPASHRPTDLSSADEAAEQGSGADPAQDDVVAAPRMRIVYVEDNLANLELIRKVLARTPSIELASAMTGSLGLELIRAERPDLVLLDLHLPGMVGEAVLDALEADPASRDTPVVVLSADVSQTRVADLLERPSVLGFLAKPIDVSALMDLVRQVQDATEVDAKA